MRHGHGYRKLNRTSSNRKALFRNLVTNLIKHEMIRTTLPKAKELRKFADRAITAAKRGGPQATNKAQELCYEHALVIPKLFGELKERYQDRPGGYTRIWKVGNRKGDNAPMAIIEYVDSPKDLKMALAHKGFIVDDPEKASRLSPDQLRCAIAHKERMQKTLKEFQDRNE